MSREAKIAAIRARRAANPSHPDNVLRHYVTGAIERGEASPILGIDSAACAAELSELARLAALAEGFATMVKGRVAKARFLRQAKAFDAQCLALSPVSADIAAMTDAEIYAELID